MLDYVVYVLNDCTVGNTLNKSSEKDEKQIKKYMDRPKVLVDVDTRH